MQLPQLAGLAVSKGLAQLVRMQAVSVVVGRNPGIAPAFERAAKQLTAEVPVVLFGEASGASLKVVESFGDAAAPGGGLTAHGRWTYGGDDAKQSEGGDPGYGWGKG